MADGALLTSSVRLQEVEASINFDPCSDPAADIGARRQARVCARGELPAFIDGEPVRLPSDVRIDFRPHAFGALATATEDPHKI